MFEAISSLMVNGNQNSDYPNVYYPLSKEELGLAEARLGFRLPDQLRVFSREVGYGFFKSSSPEKQRSGFNYINRFLAPSQIANLLLGEDQEGMPSEGFDKGEIPFFEIGDQLYLVLQPTSDFPNQVCWPFGNQITKDLVEFTNRLTTDPRFYHG